MAPRTQALELIGKLAQAEAALRGQEFLAPLVGRGRVRLRLHGLIYTLVVPGAQAGWWVCRVLDAQRAAQVEEALPWQRGDYLAHWPALRLVLVEPLRDAAWLALPYNPADAAQRFGIAGPLVVQLAEQARPFERIIGRVEGRTIWYDEPDRRADPATAEALREALAAGHESPGVTHLGAGEQAAYTLRYGRIAAERAASTADPTERRLRHALEIGGARLLGYTVGERGHLQVTWERDGRRSVTLIDDDLGVVAAGVCLSGQERRFDLASIVGVVHASPDFAYYGDDLYDDLEE
jgi:hypothetical protein